MVGTRRRTATTAGGAGNNKKPPDKPGPHKKGNVATGRVKKTALPPMKKAKVATSKGKALANTPPADQDNTGSETGSDQEQLDSIHDFADNPVATSNILRSDLPVLAGPSPNQLQRVTAAITSDADLCARLRLDFDLKWICRCPLESHKDTRYVEFPRSGPVAIPPCAVTCPYCDYNPGLKSTCGSATGRGGSIRKHIEKQHVDENAFLGLYVVSLKDSKCWFNWKPPGRTGSATAINPAPTPMAPSHARHETPINLDPVSPVPSRVATPMVGEGYDDGFFPDISDAVSPFQFAAIMAAPTYDWMDNIRLPQQLRHELTELSEDQPLPEILSPSLQPEYVTDLSVIFTEYPEGCRISEKPINGGFERVRYIAYTYAVPEYPITHPEGVAYVVDTRHLPEADVKRAYTDVQYGNGTNNNQRWQKEKKCPLLNDHLCIFVKRQCSGVKVCRQLASHIRYDYEHTDVTVSLWDRLYNDRDQIIAARASAAASDSLRTSTYNVFLEQQSHYQAICGTHCIGGQMVLRQFQDGTAWLSTLAGLDVDYLKQLFLGATQLPITTSMECETFLAPTSRLTACDTHGSGMIETQGCEVRTMVITPKNLTALPLIVYASWGSHTHPPPPMTKTPKNIVSSVQELIRKVDQRQITHGRFLRSDAVRDFLQHYQLDSLSDLHPSLGCRDLGWTSTYLEYLEEMSSPREMYIQEMYTNGNNIRIICCTPEQAQYWSQIQFFQMDMTFKRVAGDINEVVFVTKDKILKQVIVLARVFVNCDSTEMYFELFKALFHKVTEVTQSPIQWYHIHQNGIQAVIVDMCAKQASGFGHYLTTIDPSRSWQQHVQSIFIYCQVHFNRNTNRFRNTPDYRLMQSILTAQTQESCVKILRGLQASPTPGVSGWATHKIRPWILSGLNRNCSLMPPMGFRSNFDQQFRSLTGQIPDLLRIFIAFIAMVYVQPMQLQLQVLAQLLVYATRES
ncbi:hypothetical protein N7448_008825 [Penicillium atrosanguineum]|nr:hypothetical protein N7448_008825 [Penicillium atrosanguineum]